MTDCNVSVIIPVYNSAVSLARCMDSVFSQTIELYEVTIIDNGSTDNSRELVHGFRDGRIMMLEQVNQGAAVTRNRRLQIATGKNAPQGIEAD